VAALVSVIVPVHNGSTTIERALGSALAQTHRHIEVVVIDDGSTDPSWEIITGIAASDARVVTYRRPEASGGPAVPRNVGLALSRGEFLALLDQDDQWLPRKLEKQLPLFEDETIGVVYSDALTSDGASYLHDILQRDSGPAGDVEAELALQCFVPACTAVWSRRVTDTIGLFDPDLSSVDDYDYWLRAAYAGFRFGAVGECLSIYSTEGARLSNDTLLNTRMLLRLSKRHLRTSVDPSRAALFRRRIRFASHILAIEAREAHGRAGFTLLAEAISACPDPKNIRKVLSLRFFRK